MKRLKNDKGLAGMFGALVLCATFSACGSSSSNPKGCQEATCNEAGSAQGGANNDPSLAGSNSSGTVHGGVGSAGSTIDIGGMNEGGASMVESTAGESGMAGATETAAGMGGMPGAETLMVLTVSPSDGDQAAEPSTSIVLTFNHALDADTASSDTIQLLDGDSVVASDIDSDGAMVTIKPRVPLGLLGEYDVRVELGLQDSDGGALGDPFLSDFRVREGAWKTITAVPGPVYQLATTVPMTTAGEALLAWIGHVDLGHYCPTSARWFLAGEASSASKAFTGEDIQDCRSVAAASTRDGTAVLVWQEDIDYAQQYRNGAWLADGKQTVSLSNTTQHFSVGIDPAGRVSFFEHSTSGGVVWRTDADGKWSETADVVTADRSKSDARIVHDAAGNGFAAWRSQDANEADQILISKTSAPGGAWGAAAVLTGSLAGTPGSLHERGVPAIALDGAGGALLLWVKEEDPDATLMSSRYTAQDGWAEAKPVSAALVVGPMMDRPALVYDGTDFVVAFTAYTGQDTQVVNIYTARYDIIHGVWAAAEPRTTVAETPSLIRMPVMGSDAHGNLLLVWARGDEFAYARYRRIEDSWSTATALPNGAINDPYFASGARMPLGSAPNGRSALMWAARDAGDFADIQLASFF